MNQTPDGDYQTYKAEDGAFVREHFFGRDPRTRKLVEGMSDKEIWGLSRGGHDYRKVYAAYKAAQEHKGQPTVILAKTIKGWTLGSHFEGRNSTHQMKKLTAEDLAGVPRPALPRHPRLGAGQDPAALLQARARFRRARVHARAAPAARRRRPAPAVGVQAAQGPGREGARHPQEGVGQAGGGDDDGVRPPAQGAAQGQGARPALRADHPGRGAHLRPGRPLLVAQDLQPGGPALHLGRPRADAGLQGVRVGRDPARGHQRGRLHGVVHRRRQLVRHARRADDPDLHLLLDVRVPADRRRLLGRGRPDDPGLRPRRHRRADDAERRGPAARGRPLAAARAHQPRGGVLRPRVLLRARPHHQGRAGPDVRRGPGRPAGRAAARPTSCTT